MRLPPSRCTFDMFNNTVMGNKMIKAFSGHTDTEFYILTPMYKNFIKSIKMKKSILFNKHTGSGDRTPVPGTCLRGLTKNPDHNDGDYLGDRKPHRHDHKKDPYSFCTFPTKPTFELFLKTSNIGKSQFPAHRHQN